ncbi:unnamed protein product [Hanseniaspora opuntiae]
MSLVEVNHPKVSDETPNDDYNKYIDYIVQLFLKDNTTVEGSIVRYGSESITLKVKDKKTKNKTYERNLIADLKNIEAIKHTDFNFESNNEKYDYNRNELSEMNENHIKTNDQEKNDLVLVPKKKNGKSQKASKDNNQKSKTDSSQLLSLLQNPTSKESQEKKPDNKKEKTKKKKKQTRKREQICWNPPRSLHKMSLTSTPCL